MMREIKHFFIDHVPTLEDITELCNFVTEQKCIVRLEWESYASHHFKYIYENDKPHKVYNNIPEVYRL